MRRAPVLLLAPFALILGCTRPEVEAFRQRPAPVSVSVTLPEGLADREGFQKEYASALRARLATRVTVVPEGVKPPVGAAELRVEIRDLRPAPGQPSPAAIGVATGAAVGAISAVGGSRGGWAVMDGLFWGLFAGTHAAIHQERSRDRLGYQPQVVRAQVSLVKEGLSEPLWVDAIEPMEVIEAMDPLPSGSRDDDGRIREEEAKGFARVVVQKLSVQFQWTRGTGQRFYQEPAPRREESPARSQEPAPAPEPHRD
ncbi:hypothetical protein [Geothrix sp. 21YS21S-4]|uniref:hypothetical protein n=1 Tax=Geothrix sp. 21YS21S-4 TaxID=3068889 RepID=UPI0027B95CBB|nr:hypothetical protein [Geothrix sp. 21YS21S-4]